MLDWEAETGGLRGLVLDGFEILRQAVYDGQGQKYGKALSCVDFLALVSIASHLGLAHDLQNHWSSADSMCRIPLQIML